MITYFFLPVLLEAFVLQPQVSRRQGTRVSATSRDDVGRREALALALTLLPITAAAQSPLDRVVGEAELRSFATAQPLDIVITGANSGVGLEGAKLLSGAGHRVVCACRTLEKAEFAVDQCGGQARPAVCDLADLESVRNFAKTIPSTDVLVLNAGLAPSTALTEPKRTKQGFEETIGVNHLGHFALYEALEKKIQKRLVVTASPVHDPESGGGKVGSAATLGDLNGLKDIQFQMVDGGTYDPDKAYKDSKLCNMMFTAEAARRLEKRGITANAFSPGLIPAPNGFFKYQNPVFANIFNVIANVVGVAETPNFGGACLAFMAADASLDGVSGAWFDTEPPGKHQLLCHLPSAEARDLEKQKLLWRLSEELVAKA